ncbi:hypothetical protein SAMN05444398_10544 [Roseovarius pacificus]|uniref:Uncharacterized protein n=1 Tax=Roseovarius pacificus TaxID=337701 RepID=A0A1M7CZ14_9RHOB|nr:hypothetical protein SAMN05444398_10544 [Roseovarius pacificus]
MPTAKAALTANGLANDAGPAHAPYPALRIEE